MQKIKMQDLEEIKCLSEVSYSPSGKAAAYVVTQASIAKNKYFSHIWVYENGTHRQLTTGGAENTFLWLDDEHLLFPGDRSKSHTPQPGEACTVYNLINIHGGEAREYFVVPMKARSLRKINDNDYLLIGTYQHNAISLDGLEGKEREEAIARIEEEKDYEVFDELPFWANGKGVVNKTRNRLYLFHRDTQTCELLSPKFMNVSSFDYDSDNKLVLYYGHDYEWMDSQKDDLYVKHLESGETVAVALGHRYSISCANFLDGRIIFAATTGEKFGTNENPIYYLADTKTGTFREIADLDPSMRSSVGSDCRHGGGRTQKVSNHAWYYTETRGYDSFVVRLTLDGTETIVTPNTHGSVDCFDMADGKILYVGMESNGLQELYLCDEGGSNVQKLTQFNEDYLKTHSVCPVKPLSFVNQDGTEIDGWVIEPVDYDPSQTYPAILNVHGGPKAVYGEPFFHEMQFWANEGYFVFFCNPRGGDGKGNEFADIYGKRYGVWDYNDLMEFTDRVLEAYPQIDQKRVGMTGGSYGGFMANWIVGHTDRFAAVASQRSIANFISKCLTTDIGYYHNLHAVKADPWTSPMEMWERSPLAYAHRCKTPTLFIHSDEDYRCWMSEALQMFTALRMHGVPTRVCLFHGENHELSRAGKPKHRIRRLTEITKWFDKYLKHIEG